jgi:hypothetical protein
MLDFAEQMRWLVDVRYPEAEVIRVVLDNLKAAPAKSEAEWATSETHRWVVLDDP